MHYQTYIMSIRFIMGYVIISFDPVRMIGSNDFIFNIYGSIYYYLLTTLHAEIL